MNEEVNQLKGRTREILAKTVDQDKQIMAISKVRDMLRLEIKSTEQNMFNSHA